MGNKLEESFHCFHINDAMAWNQKLTCSEFWDLCERQNPALTPAELHRHLQEQIVLWGDEVDARRRDQTLLQNNKEARIADLQRAEADLAQSTQTLCRSEMELRQHNATAKAIGQLIALRGPAVGNQDANAAGDQDTNGAGSYTP